MTAPLRTHILTDHTGRVIASIPKDARIIRGEDGLWRVVTTKGKD